ncbi:hypothetical protein [Streptomyces europaeiscabiei]|uniref:hypothetical protein n=2 Tax=Streptomyces europaeiscabiei TaxID=146819 RepID=UPI0029B4BC77|nr:hypothetical protein [Streptomyces europaeiscabiei]MDX3861499.1 hypothetical protein [Streptomyces europaeiscabiei]MDX3868922.1 hypothetical protein [Streptomyces europaeiscabiei]
MNFAYGADAATFLREVAGTAADARTTDAPYWKARRTMTGAGGTTTTGTVWVGRSGIVSRASNGKYTLFPPGGEADEQMVWPVAGLEVDWDELRELPTEPRALKALLHSGTPDAPEQEAVFNGIVTLLSAPVSPQLRAALYDVLAGLPYLRLVGPVHDRAGRAGVAIEYDGEDVRSRVVIDPESALPLEESNTTLGGPEDGDLVSSVTYLSLRAVRNAPEAVPVEPLPRAEVERLRTVPFREK